MNVWQIILRLAPFVKPYKSLVIISFLLTLLGAFIAQINPLVLRYTVDTIEQLLNDGKPAREGFSLLFFISAILFGKELANIAIKYGQSMLRFTGRRPGRKMKIWKATEIRRATPNLWLYAALLPSSD